MLSKIEVQQQIIRWCKVYNHLSEDRRFNINKVKLYFLTKSSRSLKIILKFLQNDVLELLEKKYIN